MSLGPASAGPSSRGPRSLAPASLSPASLSPMTSARGSGQATEPQVREQRLSLQAAMRIGIVCWPFFAVLDLYEAKALYPGASLWKVLALRALGELVLLSVFRLTFVRRLARRTVAAAGAFAFWTCSVLLGLMALELGGLNSNYVHGLSLILGIRAAVTASRWPAAAAFSAPIALSFPLVMLAASLFRPDVGAALHDRASLARFAADYVFVLSFVAVGAACSHAVWAARQQVYEARRLGRYRLKARIGEGGMNEIWQAWDEVLFRDVALKILRADDGDRGAVKRFEHEARAASTLVEPHTIRIFDFGASDDGIYYIAMELLTGSDLGALVRESGPLSPERAVRFARQACLSLAEAHARGIVHRDIKPQNLFATRVGGDDQFLKLLDFGIARVHAPGSRDTTRTQAGQLRGTPAFMSPEQVSGGHVDARSDIYSLGATLYFLLCGAPPFTHPEPGQQMMAHLLETPARPSLRRREPLPERLEAAVLRCLSKRPGDRFQSAGELLAELDSIARELEPAVALSRRA